jgi:hypothetical protein
LIDYKCFELHTHTINSDGQFTTEALCESARQYLYDAIAVTDHNTMSALEDITPELIKRTLPVIPGIEWTTFFGHLLVIGAEKYIDWRFALPENIDTYIAEIKAVNGIVGIAHPFNVGSPLCTGCYWDFKIHNWNNVDYIEVWSEPFPQERFKNNLAFNWWTKLLNRGYKLAAGSGRDWHGPDKEDVLTSATYLGLQDGIITGVTVKEALAKGRTFVTCGPVLHITLSNAFGTCGLGETAAAGECTLTIHLDESKRRSVWERFGLRTKFIQIVHNGTTVQKIPCDGVYTGTLSLNLSPGWVRVEGYGYYNYKGKYNIDDHKLLVFSSPIFIGMRGCNT